MSRDEPEPDKLRLANDDYTVGWISALDVQRAASSATLDEIHSDLPHEPADSNIYILGRMGQHNVVIVCLPEGRNGVRAAATATNNLLRSFRQIRFSLLVGVGGGAPSPPNDNSYKDLRLVDVVVSTSDEHCGGVIQYDFGKITTDGNFIPKDALSKPPSVLRAGITKLKAIHMRGKRTMDAYIARTFGVNPDMKTEMAYPGEAHDQLFEADCDHVGKRLGCDECDQTRIVGRNSRTRKGPVIHYGLIG